MEGTRFFIDEFRSPVHVDDLASALLELLELEFPGPLHVAGADDVSRYEFAVLLGADERRIERAQTSPDRAPDVTLDSSQAAALLATRLRGVHEVLARSLSPSARRRRGPQASPGSARAGRVAARPCTRRAARRRR